MNICFVMSIFDMLYLLWGVDWVRSEGQDTSLWSIVWLKKKKSGLTKHSQFGPFLNSDKICICIVRIVVSITQIRIIADNLQVQRSDVTHWKKVCMNERCEVTAIPASWDSFPLLLSIRLENYEISVGSKLTPQVKFSDVTAFWTDSNDCLFHNSVRKSLS